MKPLLLVLILTPALLMGADAPPAVYFQKFDTLTEGKPPEEILILSGDYLIKADGANKYLELAADPLDTQGFMAGPETFLTGTVTARIHASSTGKRTPEFGLGAGGPNGYKLWLMPATNEFQINKSEKTVATVPYQWSTNTWTRLKFSTTKSPDGKFKIQGKVWPDGKEEPKDYQITYEAPEPPQPGRPTFWSTPYSGTPTKFDDLQATPAP